MQSKAVILFIVLLVASASLLMNGCKKTELHLAHIPFNTPPGFPPPVYDFTANPITEEGFRLGKKLFYDGRLSINNAIDCGSCHQPIAAFTTFEHDRSHGYNGAHTLRNAPALFNLAWLSVYTLDGRAKTLDEVIHNHITNPAEMAETIPAVLTKLKNDGEYRQLFAAAFGDDNITEPRLNKALSQFVLSLVSANAKYDKVKRNEASFSVEEQNGHAVFINKCVACHTEPLFTDNSFRNAGLAIDAGLNDAGRMRVTGLAADSLKFRVPSLRNADLTSYYTHDGRFSAFRMMLRHHRNGAIQSPTLDTLLKNGIPLTIQQENELVAFIRTLTDTAFVNTPRYRE